MEGSSSQVQPAETPANSTSHTDPSTFSLPRTASRLLSFIPAITPSLTLDGNYSIERLLALEEYTRTRSLTHVLWVIIRTPLLPAIMIIAYELPPLAPPQDGWRANWVFFFVRLGIGMVLVTEGLFAIPRLIMPELNRALTTRTRSWIAITMAMIYAGFAMLLAQVWGFPVPFTTTIVNPVVGTLLLAIIYFVARHEINESHVLQRRFFSCCCYVCTMPLMSLVYPAYMALFLLVAKNYRDYQPLVTLLVPVIKISIRKLIAKIAADCEDLIPVIIVFSIELYNALFQVICVQVGSSRVTIAVIMAIDATISLNSLYKLNKQTKTLQQLLQSSEVESLLPAIATLCENQSTPTPDNRLLSSVSLHSALQQCGLSEQGKERLESMSKMDVFSSKRVIGKPVQKPSTTQSTQSLVARAFSTKILPTILATAKRPAILMQLPSARTFPQSSRSIAILETTSLLFRSEYLLLGEYLECVIPWLYAMNLVLLWSSPNGAFYPHTRSLATRDDMLASLLNVGIFFTLELLSFLALSVVLRKRLRFSPLHQLSYVLEHQVNAIHAQMVVILIMSLHVNLDHAGADFSFHFQWLEHTNGSS